MLKNRALFATIAVALLAMAAWAGTITGTVYLPNDGGPAVGARVFASPNHHPGDTTYTGEDGSYTFTGLEGGRYVIHASLEGYRPVDASVEVGHDGTVTLNLTLGQPFTGLGNLDGHVWLPREQGPAVGATVRLQRNPMDPAIETTTDEEGYYSFQNIAAGPWGGAASLEGYQPDMRQCFVPDGETDHQNFMLRELPSGFGGVAGVVVLSHHGGPAAGATVTLTSAEFDSMWATTNEAGEFAFEHVVVGPWFVSARLGDVQSDRIPVWIHDGEMTRVVIELRGLPPVGGLVAGLVMFADGTPAAGAEVNIDGEPGRPGHFHERTNEAGQFTFEYIPVGMWQIFASARMHGWARAEIEVLEGATTNVTLTLADSGNGGGGGGGGGHHGDSLTIVELTGTVIVVRGDPARPRVGYMLDTDGDGQGDYRLGFGPPWYHPDNGATRPEAGETVTVSGGLLTYTDPPIVVVYTINGQFWRQPGRGHGGHGGGDHDRRGCNADSLTRVELVGLAMVREGDGGFHNDRVRYAIDTDADGAVNAFLDFGAPDYQPESGATRPEAGDEITIVGGQIFCPNAPIPVVLVYEINGLLWREPGDTLSLGPLTELSADEPIAIGAPTSYLTATNFPNPFNPSTVIRYSVPVSGTVRLAVFDITGREVEELVSTTQAAGTYAVNWNAAGLSSGIYFYRLTAGSQSITNKMVLMK